MKDKIVEVLKDFEGFGIASNMAEKIADRLIPVVNDHMLSKQSKDDFTKQAALHALSGCTYAHVTGNAHYKHMDIVKDAVDIAKKLADSFVFEEK